MSAAQATPRPVAPEDSISLAALTGFQQQLSRRLAENPLDCVTAWRLAEIARAAGDLDVAIRAYRTCLAVDPGNVLARRMSAVLEGRMPPAGATDAEDRPVPFLKFDNLMPAAGLEDMWRIVRDRRRELQPSLISRAGQTDLLVPSYRHSLAMPGRRDAGPLILSAIAAVLDPLAVTRLFGTRAFRLDGDRTEVEIAAHSDSDFFRIHRDAGPLHPDRVVTFVFYLFREPRCFTGGDLLLHDRSAAGLPRAQRFTRFGPTNNRLLVFPSDGWHQVLPVRCRTDDPLDGRLTVHGWFHSA